MWNVVKTAEEIGGEVELTGQEAGLMNNWILDINDLDTENNIVLNKVKDQPGLTAINFDLLKSIPLENVELIMFGGEVMPVKQLNYWKKYLPK